MVRIQYIPQFDDPKNEKNVMILSSYSNAAIHCR